MICLLCIGPSISISDCIAFRLELIVFFVAHLNAENIYQFIQKQKVEIDLICYHFNELPHMWQPIC